MIGLDPILLLRDLDAFNLARAGRRLTGNRFMLKGFNENLRSTHLSPPSRQTPIKGSRQSMSDKRNNSQTPKTPNRKWSLSDFDNPVKLPRPMLWPHSRKTRGFVEDRARNRFLDGIEKLKFLRNTSECHDQYSQRQSAGYSKRPAAGT